jgi:hypothetical protein
MRLVQPTERDERSRHHALARLIRERAHERLASVV